MWLVVLAMVLAPGALRMLTWHGVRPQAVDAAMAQAGKTLFDHEWVPHDPLAAGGDGLGPVYNATSCVACHNQGGAGGGGGLESNVTTFTVRSGGSGEVARQGVVHAYAVGNAETLAHVHPQLPPIAQPTAAQLVPLSGDSKHLIRFPPGVHVSQRNTPALFGVQWIDAIPDRIIIANERNQRLKWGMASTNEETLPVGRALRLANGRVGHFGWKAQTASLADFVQAACANELGLGNPGQAQPRPLSQPVYAAPGMDLTAEQCDQLTGFLVSLPRPVERLPADPSEREAAQAGKTMFGKIGCADCHTTEIGGVEGIYSDLLLHRMGQDLVGGGSYGEKPLPLPESPAPSDGPQPDEWRTPPLWGVADSAPYLHDGRAANLEEAIRLHGGQGAAAAERFRLAAPTERAQVVAFLQTLRAP
jgi:CxxC motif-containing protein (DUF1111 family)